MKKIIVALLMVMCLFMVTSCVPSNLKKAQAKMEKAGYTCEVMEDDIYDLKEEYGEDLVGVMDAYKESGDVSYISALLFKSKKAAKEYLSSFKEASEDPDVEIIQAGKWILAGSTDAIKAFKK